MAKQFKNKSQQYAARQAYLTAYRRRRRRRRK